jgi:hypothetical protein
VAERCSKCGSADTSTGALNFRCLDCGTVTEYDGLAEKGVVADDSGYYGDTGTVYHGDPSVAPAKAPAKATKTKKR